MPSWPNLPAVSARPEATLSRTKESCRMNPTTPPSTGLHVCSICGCQWAHPEQTDCPLCSAQSAWKAVSDLQAPVSGEGTGTLTRYIEKLEAQAVESIAESSRIHSAIHHTTDAEERCLVRAEVWRKCAKELQPITADVDRRLSDANLLQVEVETLRGVTRIYEEKLRAKDAQLAECGRIGADELTKRHDAEEALADLRRQGEWQPIETAPERQKVFVSWVNALGNRRTTLASYWPAGTLALDDAPDEIVNEEGHNAEAGWFECREAGDAVDWHLNEELTHWRPVPDPPAQ